MSPFGLAILTSFVVVFVLALALLVLVAQGALRLHRHHSPALSRQGIFGAVALLWMLSITYNLRVLAQLAGRDARLASLPLIGTHVRDLRRAERVDQSLQRTFDRFARWYPPYLVLFGGLFGAISVGGILAY